jgi:hypothetical protein
LQRSEPVDWSLERTAGGTRVVVSAPAEIDVVDLGSSAAQALEHGHHPPLTVIGSFSTLGPPTDLPQFLVGGTVLDTNDFLGRRCPSEQTALSVYRVARLRGGPFWDGVATYVATAVADRIRQAPGGLPVHDLAGEGETHVRFLADAILLLLAEAERQSDGKLANLASKTVGALDAFAVPWADGIWYVHDSAERDAGANQLVLNTHVHALVARVAAGCSIDDGLRALERGLSLTGDRIRSSVLAAALAVSDRARASNIEAVASAGGRLHWMAEASAGRSRARTPHLRLPGGWMARDAGPAPNASYLLVNLHDLAVLQRNRPTSDVAGALRAGIRYGRFSGFFDAQTAARDANAILIPSLLTNAGNLEAARRAATRLRRHGVHPAVGWPGFHDRLWSRLALGTP